MSRGIVVSIIVAACGAPTAPPPIESKAPPAAPAAPSPPPPSCEGHDAQLYGTTCCDVPAASEREKFPGMTYLWCTGAQIGKTCTKKGDCDVVCSCDDPRLKPNHGRAGPPDGTRGVIGRCGGHLEIGVWMCQLDEHGLVSHVIVD